MNPADKPIAYMERTRSYYAALGYEQPYRWAAFATVPFTPLRRPLAEATVAVVTTAAPYREEAGEQGPGAPYNAAAKFHRVWSVSSDGDPDVRIAHVAIDRDHASMDDPGAWFPLKALREAAAVGRIGRVAPQVHGLPTTRSQRETLERDGPEIVARLREDGADAAVLVPNCPVCHQCCAIAARLIEEAGIASVVMGAALDIVEHAGVPRFLFSDFPLGNAAGRPHDPASQAETLEMALSLLETAEGPRTTVRSGLRWADDQSWKRDYANAERLSPEELRERRAAFDADKAVAKEDRLAAGEGGS